MTPDDANNTSPDQVGVLLRRWRTLRGKSQLALANDTGISQRHISFVESGRSFPGRQILIDLASALAMPMRERNALLLAAGYAASWSEGGWSDENMDAIGKALDRILTQHEPFPALVLDRHWNVVKTNASAPSLFGWFVNLGARPTPRNLLDLIFDPTGLRPFIANWHDVARGLIERIQREAVGQVLDRDMQGLLRRLLAYPDVPPAETTTTSRSLPMIPIVLSKDGKRLSYFSMLTTVGTPQSITAQELRIECMYPTDDDSEYAHRQLMAEI